MRIIRFIWALFKYALVGKTVSSAIYDKRITVCESCEHLTNNQCNLCGCYVKKKAKWSTERCPKNKW